MARSGRLLFAVADAGEPAPAAAAAAARAAEPAALAQLSDLAARSASGELVCSGSGGEIHVFLQGGRIAWATSSAQRHAFTEHLKAVTGVGDDVIEAVVSECSRTRRPIGEALIAWNIASADQVRASLLHQIRRALATAVEASDARTLFLEREQYRRYDSALTFPLAEVLAPPAGATPAGPGGDDDAPRADDPAAALAATDGLLAAAVLPPHGEPLAVIGDAARVAGLAGLAQQLLQQGGRLSIDAGAGLCRELHVDTGDDHVLIYSARVGPRLPLRIVLVLRDVAVAAVARSRAVAVAAAVGAGGA
jgi:hypothetical protein